MNRLAFEQLGMGRGEYVLEVGFGGGDLIEWLVSAGETRVIGVDPSQAMLKRAKRRFRDRVAQGQVELLAGSAEALPIVDRSIDKACSVNSAYFWPDPAAAMAEFARVLRPGGRLVLCLQSPQSVRAWPGHVHGFRAHDADELVCLMATAGFGPVRRTEGEAPAVGYFFCLSSERENG